jgi:hypothetical protein
MVVECAIGLLKGRFRIFARPLDLHGNINNGFQSVPCTNGYDNAAKIIRACFILHNILIEVNDLTPVELSRVSHDVLAEELPANDLVCGEEAKQRRNMIKNYLWEVK